MIPGVQYPNINPTINPPQYQINNPNIMGGLNQPPLGYNKYGRTFPPPPLNVSQLPPMHPNMPYQPMQSRQPVQIPQSYYP